MSPPDALAAHPQGYTLDSPTPANDAGKASSNPFLVLDAQNAATPKQSGAPTNPFLALDAQAAAASRSGQAPQSDAASLPSGLTLDSPPSLVDRVGGIAERGVVHGATDIAGAAQAAGRWFDRE